MTKKRFQFVLKLGLLLFVLLYLCLLLVVTLNKTTYMPKSSDAILVLGHSLKEDKTPSEWLALRLEGALFLYQNKFAPKIIVAGGNGNSNDISVAFAMGEWLVAKGVPKEAIILEEQSKDTYQNFFYAKQLAKINNIHSVVVVTSSFHMQRSMWLAETFFEEYSGYSTPVPSGINTMLAYAKEPLSLMKIWILKLIFNTWDVA